ncbi:MAG: hypothetical protein K2G88_09735 [Oscillospiraceae bacterium]|nr:hypothetical protein [Oscillospiraceae bacterium]MDE6658013.1 hypothetical protein [Oscillospiraceae bacterium]
MNQKKEDEILNFVRDYIQKESVPPSVREICKGTNTGSTSTVHRYLHKLKADGKINMDSTKNRTIVIREKQGLPVMRHVEAGTELFDTCNICDYFNYMPNKKYQNLLFAVYSQENMPELNILKGDVIIAEKSAKGEYLIIADENGEISVICQKDLISGQVLGALVALVREFERKE